MPQRLAPTPQAVDFPGTRKLKLLLVCVATLKDDEPFVKIGVVSLSPYSRLLRFCPALKKAWVPVDSGGTPSTTRKDNDR